MNQTAIIVVDMWDTHWCQHLLARLPDLVERMAGALDRARALGAQVIYAPSGVLKAYLPEREPYFPDWPALSVPVEPECAVCEHAFIWTRQHPALPIHASDILSTNPERIFALTTGKRLAYIGSALNACILNRPYGIRAALSWGFSVGIDPQLVEVLHAPSLAHDAAVAQMVSFVQGLGVSLLSLP